jgi:hypothetical protein
MTVAGNDGDISQQHSHPQVLTQYLAEMVVATALAVPELHAPFQLAEVELDSIRSDEVLVELKSTSICATDPAVRHGKISLAFPVILDREGVWSSQSNPMILAEIASIEAPVS